MRSVSPNRHTDYGALFLQMAGAFPSGPAIAAWIAINFEPRYKKAVAIAIANSFLNCGGTLISWFLRVSSKPLSSLIGIVSVWLYNDPPRYKKATTLNIAFSVGVIFLICLNMALLRRKNKRRAASMKEISESGTAMATELGIRSDSESTSEKFEGNLHPTFVYSL